MDEDVKWTAALHTGEHVGTVVVALGTSDAPPQELTPENTVGPLPRGPWSLLGFDREAGTASYEQR